MGPKPRPEHAGQGLDQPQGGNGSARQPRPPGSPIVHMEGPLIGPSHLRSALQHLTDRLGPEFLVNSQIAFMGTVQRQAGLAVSVPGLKGQMQQQVEMMPAFVICFVIEACDHGDDPINCKDCAEEQAAESGVEAEPGEPVQ